LIGVLPGELRVVIGFRPASACSVVAFRLGAPPPRMSAKSPKNQPRPLARKTPVFTRFRRMPNRG
jgi:hypothetical protein